MFRKSFLIEDILDRRSPRAPPPPPSWPMAPHLYGLYCAAVANSQHLLVNAEEVVTASTPEMMANRSDGRKTRRNRTVFTELQLIGLEERFDTQLRVGAFSRLNSTSGQDLVSKPKNEMEKTGHAHRMSRPAHQTQGAPKEELNSFAQRNACGRRGRPRPLEGATTTCAQQSVPMSVCLALRLRESYFNKSYFISFVTSRKAWLLVGFVSKGVSLTMSAKDFFAAKEALPVLLVLVVVVVVVFGDEKPATNEPQFVSQGGQKWLREGQDVELECEVRDLGEFVILWKFNKSQVLFAGNLRIHRDDRISRDDRTGSLRIRDFRPEFGGEYQCQVSTNPPQDITYSVALIGPPRIEATPSTGQVIVSTNHTLTLQCMATADHFRWRKYADDPSVPPRDLPFTGHTLHVKHARPTDAGTYECEAHNTIGESRHEFVVQVFYPPQVHAHQSVVHAPEGRPAHIACIVSAEPSATVVWFGRNGRVLPSDNVRFGRHNRTSTLTIGHVTHDLYDNYTCVANNTLGSAHSTVEVTGKPSRALFSSPVLAGHHHSYDITWSVDSESPITSYELRIRPLNHDMNDTTRDQTNTWQHFRVLSTDSSTESSPPRRTQTFRLEHLLLDRDYEADVVAYNAFGATRSAIFSFVTSSAAAAASGRLCLIVYIVGVWGALRGCK